MSGETSFVKAKYSEAADEVKVFPTEVSAPGAKSFDKFLEEHTLTIKKRAASYNAVSGELGLQESNAKTTTLPAAATANQLIAVTSLVAEAKITTSGGAFIYGKWLTVASATATVVLTQDMTAFFQSDGTNWLLWGEIKDERTYGASVLRLVNTAYEPNTIRPTWVRMEVTGELEKPLSCKVIVGGTVMGGFAVGKDAGLIPILTDSFMVNPGQKWEVEGSHIASVHSYYLAL